MVTKTEGLILKKIEYQESSLILKIFTKDFGIISVIAKGAKSSKKSAYGILRPLNFIEFQFYHQNNKTLFLLKDYQLKFAPDTKNFGIYKTSLAYFIVEVISHSTSEELEPEPEKYEFVMSIFEYLKQHHVYSNFYLCFLIQYVRFLGFEISSQLFSNQETISIVEKLMIPDSMYQKLEILPGQRKSIYQSLIQFYQFHIPNFKEIQSIQTLEMIF